LVADEHALHDNLGWLLWRLYRQAQAAEQEALERHGLRDLTYAVLLLAHQPTSSQQALAATIGVDRTKMVALVDELEAAGLVARRPDPVDRRAHIIEPTQAGRKVLRAARLDVRRAEDELLLPLTALDREAMRARLRTLVSRSGPEN
jgi:DNA-binding MarR family transcriptional regulator